MLATAPLGRPRILLKLALALLLLVALAGAQEDDHEGHDHGDEGDDHDDHDGHDHGAEGKAYEWAGAFDMVRGVHTLTMAKVGGKYADATMLLSLLPVPDAEMGVESVEPKFNEMLEHAKHCAEEEDHDDHGHEEEEGHEEGGHEEMPCPKHLTTQGMTLQLQDRGGAPEAGTFKLSMDGDAAMTMFLINITSPGRYVLAAEHHMLEFEQGRHFLQGPDGEDLEPLDDLPGCESSGLPTGEAWGFSILGSLIGQVLTVLLAVLLVYPLLSKGDFATIHDNMALLSAFASGTLTGLVFLHLIPEASALTGGLGWEVNTLIVAGFFVGLLITFFLPHPEHGDDGFELAETAPQRDLKPPAPAVPQLPAGPPQFQVGSPFPVPPFGAPPAFPGAPLTAKSLAAKERSPEDSPFDQRSVASSRYSTILQPIVVNILVGDFFHNLFDGIAIAAAFRSCGALGWLVTASVVLHEIPQELSDFSILVRAGLSVPTALCANLASASSTFIGIVIAMTISTEAESASTLNVATGRMLAFSSGILLYVTFETLKRVHRPKDGVRRVAVLLCLAAGTIIIGVLGLLHPHCESCGAGGDHEGHNH